MNTNILNLVGLGRGLAFMMMVAVGLTLTPNIAHAQDPEISVYWRSATNSNGADIGALYRPGLLANAVSGSIDNTATILEGNAANDGLHMVIRRTDGTRVGRPSGSGAGNISVRWRVYQPDGIAVEGFGAAGRINDDDNSSYEVVNEAHTQFPTEPGNVRTAATSDVGNATISYDHEGIIIPFKFGNSGDDNRSRRVIVELLDGNGYTVSSTNNNATLTIYDDDGVASFATNANSGSVTEGNSLTISVSHNPAVVASVQSVTLNVTSDPGMHFGGVGRQYNATFFAGSISGDVEVTAARANITSPVNATFRIVTTTGTDGVVDSGYTVHGADHTYTATVNPVPPPVVTPPPTNITTPPGPVTGNNVTFAGMTTGATYTVNETGTLTVNLTLDVNAGTGGQDVFVSTMAATAGTAAVAGREYPVFSNRVVNIPVGQNSTLYEIRIPENNVYYSGGSSNFTVIAAVGGQNTSASAVVTITDNDAVPELEIVGPGRIAPGRNATFTVQSLTSVPADEVTDIGLTINGSATHIFADMNETVMSNSTDVTVTLPALANRVQFVVTANASDNASVTFDPILVYFGAVQSGAPYNVSATGRTIATARVAASGLDAVALNNVILPQAVATVIDQTGQAIATRSQNSFGDQGASRGFTIGGQDPLSFAEGVAQSLARHEASENPWDAPSASSAQSLALQELANAGELSLVLPLNRGEGRGSFAIWAEGFTRSIDGDQNGVEFDGDVPGAIFGADARVGENLLAGIAVASATADFAYKDRRDDANPLEGSHETELSSYHPYIGYRTEGGTNVWANFGVGEGEVTITGGDDNRYVGELETLSYAIGFTNLRDSREDGNEGLALNYHGDVSFTNIEETPTARSRGNPAFDGATGSEVSQSRARLGARLSHTKQNADGGEKRTSLGIAIRYDQGDTAEGGAVEIDGGIGYTLGDNLKLDLSARTLLFHEESVDDWGFAGGFTWRGNPTGAGRGLTLAVTPEWGNTQSRADALLDSGVGAGLGVPADAGDAGEARARYGFDVRYGLAVVGDDLLVPFVRGDANDGDATVFGSQYHFGGFEAGVESAVADDEGNAFVRYYREF